MAAACFERKVSDVLLACKLQDFVDVPQHDLTALTATSVLDMVAAAARTPTPSSPSPLPCLVSASPPSNLGFKDYSQPLHVDCSVEYELPSQTKPPPGGGEPLLMIHPCYYRRAERETRSIFVNNLPPRGSLSSSSQVRRSSSRRNAAALVAVATASTAPSTSTPSVVTATTATAAVAAAAATYQAALTAAASLAHHQEQKPSKIQIVGATATEHEVQSDERAVLASIYPQYFSTIRGRGQHVPHQPRHPEQQLPPGQASLHIHRHIPPQHHQHQTNPVSSSTTTPLANVLRQSFQPQQQSQPTQQQHSQTQPQYASQTSHLMSSRHPSTVGSTATTTVHGHHPYRRSTTDRGSQIRSLAKQTSMSTNPSLSAAVTVATSGMSSNVYASAIHRHHAIHPLQVNGFYEMPVYHALLPQS